MRFWHPREQDWSRNLLVTSSYGLSLHPTLQTGIPPSRDSTQTAQFAAALAALEPEKWSQLRCVPPRRFEIAKNGAVDLSVLPTSDGCAASTILHPDNSRSETQSLGPWPWIVICVGGAIALVGLTCYFGPLRRLTWEASQFQAEILHYAEEDVGSPEGALTLVRHLQQLTHEQKDCWGRWLNASKKYLR